MGISKRTTVFQSCPCLSHEGDTPYTATQSCVFHYFYSCVGVGAGRPAISRLLDDEKLQSTMAARDVLKKIGTTQLNILDR